MNFYTIYILLYLSYISASADLECIDAEYLGLYFSPPSDYDPASFSKYGLARFNNITFNIKVDCTSYNFSNLNYAPSMFLSITNNTPLLDTELLQDLFTVAYIKQNSLEDAIPKQVWIENITRWIDDVWNPYFINQTKLYNDSDIIAEDILLPNWRNIWLLTADMEPIHSLCNTTHSTTPINTQLTYKWTEEYTQLFPIFEHHEMSKNQSWIDTETSMRLETIWDAKHVINDTLYYNIVLLKEDNYWLQCFMQSATITNEAKWQTSITSYYFETEEDNATFIDELAQWDYTLSSNTFSPLIAYNNCNVSQLSISPDTGAEICSKEMCCHYAGSPHRFNMYFWYDDDVWTNSLAFYQRLMQYAIEEALADTYFDVFGVIYPPNKFYVFVSYFFNFCLVKSGGCPNYDNERNEELLAYFPKNIGKESLAPYKMYATFRTKPLLKAEKVWQMLAENEANVEIFNTHVVRRVKEDFGRYNFKWYGIAVSKLPQRIIFKVPQYLGYGLYSFVGLCTIFALAGAIHGFVYWGADCVRISGIVYFGLYTWDFYSDIVFNLELLNYEDTQYLFYICSAFIVIPWIGNMISLSRYQQRWCKDDAIRERVYSWFVSWQRLTYALAAVSGSAFGTVELANSYVFGIDFFCMGLNERHLKRFNNNRLWSGILLENFPQLIVQFWFLYTLDWEPENNIVWMAIMASSLSIMAACLDIYSAKKLFEVLEPDGVAIGTVSCSLYILSQEIKEKAKKLQVSTYALRDAIAETLTTHCRSVEIHFPITTADGFKVAFTVFSSKLEPDVIYSRLKKNAVSRDGKKLAELPKKIQKVWRLRTLPKIPVEDIYVDGVDKESFCDPEPYKGDSSESEKEGGDIEMMNYNKKGKMENLEEGNSGISTLTVDISGAKAMIGSFKNVPKEEDGGKYGTVTDYDAQIASLNAQIAMNQYFMMKQMQHVKDMKHVEEDEEMQSLMMKQMEEINGMINMSKEYDVNIFEEFNKDWKVHKNRINTYEAPKITSMASDEIEVNNDDNDEAQQ